MTYGEVRERILMLKAEIKNEVNKMDGLVERWIIADTRAESRVWYRYGEDVRRQKRKIKDLVESLELALIEEARMESGQK